MPSQLNVDEAIQELSTIRDFIRWAVTQFNQAELVYGHGTENAWDEAVNLVLTALSLPPDIDASVLEAKLCRTEKNVLAGYFRKRVEERIPAPYLVHEAWFAGLNFYVDERVIIPRSPIAELIEEAFSPWVEETHVGRVLDLCTGSGCIAIGTAMAFPGAIVDAVDSSLDALAVAQINVERFGLEENVFLIESDLFSALDDKRYDIIVSNPPYVSKTEYDALPPEYHHEPERALLSEEDGLSIVNRILCEAERYLTPTGVLIVEVGCAQERLEAKYPDVPFTWLQFKEGGDGVFLLTAEELRECQPLLRLLRSAMSGNTFGKCFRVTSFGESHGPALGGVVDGCPSGLPLTQEAIQVALERRRPGLSPFTSQRRESDRVEILSGVFEGKTTGAPIGFLIRNENARTRDYEKIKSSFRPGHGDYTYFHKYGIRDYRGGGRASARETVVRVAAGAIAQKYLSEVSGITIRAYLSQMGSISIEPQHCVWDSLANPFFCPDPTKTEALAALIEGLRREGNSVGARVTVEAMNVPPGLGEPVFDRLDADLAKALMSINAVKGVEIGDGFAVVTQKGSEHRDEITPQGFLTNHSGGILAGISTGQVICASVAVKPAASIRIPGRSIDERGVPVEVVTTGRHDPCVGIRAVPVVEAMMALVLMDHWLMVFGQRLRTPSKCAEEKTV